MFPITCPKCRHTFFSAEDRGGLLTVCPACRHRWEPSGQPVPEPLSTEDLTPPDKRTSLGTVSPPPEGSHTSSNDEASAAGGAGLPEGLPESVCQLGTPAAVHARRTSVVIAILLLSLLLLGLAAIFFVPLGVLLLRLVSGQGLILGPPRTAVGPLLGIAFCCLLGLLCLAFGIGQFVRWRRMAEVLAVLVFGDRLVCVKHRRVVTFRWDEIEAVWLRITGKRFGRANRPAKTNLHHSYKIRRRDGEQICLTSALAGAERLGETIQTEVCRRQLPAALDTFRTGRAVDFGRLRIGPEGMSCCTITASGPRTSLVVPWGDIRYLAVEGGILSIQVRDHVESGIAEPVFHIPNLRVLLELVKQAVGIPVEAESLAEVTESRSTNSLGAFRSESPLPWVPDKSTRTGPQDRILAAAEEDVLNERGAALLRELPKDLPEEVHQLGLPMALFHADGITVILRIWITFATLVLSLAVMAVPAALVLFLDMAVTGGSRPSWVGLLFVTVFVLRLPLPLLLVTAVWVVRLVREVGRLALFAVASVVVAFGITGLGIVLEQVLLGLIVVVLALGAELLSLKRARHLLLYAVLCFHGGLVYLRRNRLRQLGDSLLLCRWDEVETVWQSSLGVVSRLAHRPDGKEIEFDSVLLDMDRASAPILQETRRRLLPPALAAYDAGASLEFGVFRLSREGIGKGNALLPWEQFKEVTFAKNNETIRLHQKERRRPWSEADVCDIPNFHVFQALMQQALDKRPKTG